MELVVRPSTSADVDELTAMAADARAAVRDERGGVALLRDLGLAGDGVLDGELGRGSRDSGSMVWVAALDDVPIGYLEARLDDEGDERVVVVRQLWVAPGAREVGAGEGLIGAALAWAIAEDADAIDAFALPGARATKNLFERSGLTARLVTLRRTLR